MERSVILAYLAGVLDSDGYVKISVQKALRMRLTGYATIIGVSQLWPSEAINLFEETFGGKKYGPMRKPGSRAMVRWEVRDCISEIALSELAPFVLVKDEQAKLLLKFIGLKTKISETVLRLNSGMSPLLQTLVRNRFAAEFVPDLDATRRKMIALNEGLGIPEPTLEAQKASLPSKIERWTREQIFSYLAGVMDSVGNFKIERKVVPGMINPFYRVCVRAAQVIPSPAIELFARTFGGNVAIK